MAYASFCLFNCVFVFVKLSVTLVTFELTSFCYFSLCYIILLNYFLFNLFLFLQKSGGAKSPPPQSLPLCGPWALKHAFILQW